MRTLTLTALIVAAGFAAAGSASAAPREMTDGAYLALARCAGMAEGLGVDAAALNKALDVQSDVRTGDVVARADQAKSDAKRNAAHVGQDGRASYQRELSGACQSLITAS